MLTMPHEIHAGERATVSAGEHVYLGYGATVDVLP